MVGDGPLGVVWRDPAVVVEGQHHDGPLRQWHEQVAQSPPQRRPCHVQTHDRGLQRVHAASHAAWVLLCACMHITTRHISSSRDSVYKSHHQPNICSRTMAQQPEYDEFRARGHVVITG